MNRDRKDRPNRSGVTPTRRITSDEASAEHRRKLEAMFGGKPTEPAKSAATGAAVRRTPSGRVFSSPRKSTGRQPSEYRMRLERLRIAREPDEIKEATDAFLKHHQLPDDLDVLYKVLQHPDEKVLREAMGQISSLMIQGRVSGTLLLRDRLKSLAERVQEEATKSYVSGLQDQLAKLES